MESAYLVGKTDTLWLIIGITQHLAVSARILRLPRSVSQTEVNPSEPLHYCFHYRSLRVKLPQVVQDSSGGAEAAVSPSPSTPTLAFLAFI